MPDLARLAAQLRGIADQLDPAVPLPDPDTTPGKPTGLAWNPRTSTLTWDPAADAAHWEVRDDRDPNPATRVKAVVDEPRSPRSPLTATSRPRRYVIVAVGPTGLRSEASEPLDVPAAGTTSPTPTVPGPGRRYPSEVLPILRTWTVTTTTGKQGSPFNDYLVGEDIPDVFYVRDDGGVMFHATVDGFHTPNSHRCRVEGRQMADANWTKAAWDGADPHVMEVDLWASTAGLTKRKRVSALQIHDGADDVIQVVADADLGLAVLSDDGHTVNVLDPAYQDGQRFTCRIDTGDGKIRVTYNGAKTVELAKTGTGWYFKAGAYNQASMEEHGEPPSAYGEVVIYRLAVEGKALA